MDVTKPGTIKELLAKYNLSIRKSWGQNFLLNSQVIEKIAQAAEITKEEMVLEVGPGLGVLTQELLTRAGQVTALEIDPRLCQLLRDRFGHHPVFTLINGDALEYDYSVLPRGYKAVANLPYYITSPFIFQLLEGGNPPQLAVLLVQLEVAKRLAAGPGAPDYGAMSVAVQYYCQVDLVTRVGGGNFYPPPKVDSAVVKLTWHQQRPYQPVSPQLMFRIIKLAFGQRRKMLKNLVASGIGLPVTTVVQVLEEMGISPGVRGEELSVAAYSELSDRLGAHL